MTHAKALNQYSEYLKTGDIDTLRKAYFTEVQAVEQTTDLAHKAIYYRSAAAMALKLGELQKAVEICLKARQLPVAQELLEDIDAVMERVQDEARRRKATRESAT